MANAVPAASLMVAAALLAGACDHAPPPAEPTLAGRVVDEDGDPVRDAEICWIAGEALGPCTRSDDNGRLALPGPARDRFKVIADGFHAVQLRADALDEPIVLGRAPILFVELGDAVTGEPIDQGSVRVTYPSGRELGPFPVNRAGVRIRRVLPPGRVILRPEAPGYGTIDPVPVRLEAGKESRVRIPMPPAD